MEKIKVYRAKNKNTGLYAVAGRYNRDKPLGKIFTTKSAAVNCLLNKSKYRTELNDKKAIAEDYVIEEYWLSYVDSYVPCGGKCNGC